MDEHTVELPIVGSNPFLEDEALVDVLSRLGFSPENSMHLCRWWRWSAQVPFDPDVLASAIMMALPPETDDAADKRRTLARAGVVQSAYRHPNRKPRVKKS